MAPQTSSASPSYVRFSLLARPPSSERRFSSSPLSPIVFCILFLSQNLMATEVSLPVRYCSDLLATNRALADRIFAEAPTLTKDFGLPKNHSDKPIIRRGDPILNAIESRTGTSIPTLPSIRPPFEVFMESDVGLTVWNWTDQVHWSQLQKILKSENQAHTELLRILNTPGYCTPGILAELCHHLRESYKIARQVMDDIPDRPKPSDEDEEARQAIETLRLRNSLHKKRTFDKGLFNFSWIGLDEQRDVPVLPQKAFRLLEIFVREALLRHTLYLAVDGTFRAVVDSLNLQTRLLVAEYMDLVPMIPVYAVAPPKIDSRNLIGDQGFFSIAHRELILKGNPVQLSIVVDTFSEDALESREFAEGQISIEFYPNLEPTTAQTIRSFKLIATNWIQQIAQEYRSLRHLKEREFQIDLRWIENSFVAVPRAKDRKHFLLFAHFVARGC